MKREVEILAPAGSWECLEAAVCAGADAIYIGGSRFGARAHADNLNEERMLEAIDYVHLHGRRLYMTVNTLFKEDELEELENYMRPPILRTRAGCSDCAGYRGYAPDSGSISRSSASCKYSGNCDTNTERTTFSENGSRENCAGKRVVSGRN